MNNRITPWVFATALSVLALGCSQTYTPFSDQLSGSTTNNQRQDIEYHHSFDVKWLDYADPRAEANLAIQKHDLKLLAFASRASSLPGIDGESEALQKICGYRLLAKTGDILSSKKESELHKNLYQYAATYNQLVAAACQKENREE